MVLRRENIRKYNGDEYPEIPSEYPEIPSEHDLALRRENIRKYNGDNLGNSLDVVEEDYVVEKDYE